MTCCGGRGHLPGVCRAASGRATGPDPKRPRKPGAGDARCQGIGRAGLVPQGKARPAA